MRTHEQIIADADGPTALGKAIGIDPNTVKQWKRNKSIPAPHFRRIVDAGLATSDELIDAAAQRSTQDAAA
jgi:hypothetical protein